MSTTNDPAPAPGASLPSASSSALGPSSTTPVISTVGDATVPSTVGGQVGEEQVARGAFVVLEGLDRSGKTTQVKLLQSRLIEAGRRVQLMRFPGELLVSCVRWWGRVHYGAWVALGLMADSSDG